MDQLEWLAIEQLIGRLVAVHLDAQASASVQDPEPEAHQARRESRSEDQRVAVVAHPAETAHHGVPHARQRGQVHAVMGVEGEVA